PVFLPGPCLDLEEWILDAGHVRHGPSPRAAQGTHAPYAVAWPDDRLRVFRSQCSRRHPAATNHPEKAHGGHALRVNGTALQDFHREPGHLTHFAVGI